MPKGTEGPKLTREQARKSAAEIELSLEAKELIMKAGSAAEPTPEEIERVAMTVSQALLGVQGYTTSEVLGSQAIETQNENPVSFAEAAQKLNEAGFDLEKARSEAVRMHEQWGLVKALQAKGAVQNAD